ncbi:hypothetical protein KP509_01G001000 [Ceratopteris richardii]|uniref:Uncharacterized protein n=1 Tax=Ceratopteris richardii TaxID=49495 RepID=A0A8T2VDJ1_CERRI|nr:hypothetical protein KP509_01G001000 [Ceratopteris richardii]
MLFFTDAKDQLNVIYEVNEDFDAKDSSMLPNPFLIELEEQMEKEELKKILEERTSPFPSHLSLVPLFKDQELGKKTSLDQLNNRDLCNDDPLKRRYCMSLCKSRDPMCNHTKSDIELLQIVTYPTCKNPMEKGETLIHNHCIVEIKAPIFT